MLGFQSGFATDFGFKSLFYKNCFYNLKNQPNYDGAQNSDPTSSPESRFKVQNSSLSRIIFMKRKQQV